MIISLEKNSQECNHCIINAWLVFKECTKLFPKILYYMHSHWWSNLLAFYKGWHHYFFKFEPSDRYVVIVYVCVYILLNPMDVVLIFISLMINDFEHLYMCPFDICVYSSLGYILSIIRLGCLSSHRTLLRILLFVLALRQLICSSGWSWALKIFPLSFRVLGTIRMDHHACLWEVWMLVCC